MRKQFAEFLHEEMSYNPSIVILTGDLGYGLWDKIKIDYPDRITPFAIYRPFELLRNYLHHENIPVKIVGGGRNKDYGYLGFSHWAEEDIKILSTLENIKLYKPKKSSPSIYQDFLYNHKPSYLNLKR